MSRPALARIVPWLVIAALIALADHASKSAISAKKPSQNKAMRANPNHA